MWAFVDDVGLSAHEGWSDDHAVTEEDDGQTQVVPEECVAPWQLECRGTAAVERGMVFDVWRSGVDGG